MKVAELQINQGLGPLRPAHQGAKSSPQTEQATGTPFGNLLKTKLIQNSELKFSAHAIKRMEARAVTLNELDLQRLEQGLHQLQARGAQNSVILLDERAFVISVKNKTVVTAIDHYQQQKVFTNIDSLAIV